MSYFKSQKAELPANLSFPVELSLRTTTEDIRLFRQPVCELEIVHTHTLQRTDYSLKSRLNRQATFKRNGPTGK
ncbi:MAG: hypothetical protein QGH37_28760 [Candidatus Poribacteria bacterium]|nr:hypothetical protein [Candidatus Poribacteria bacterium]MDP6997646.1 hypothetical protein [Candidatus Poribacteria bacterium]